MRELSYGEGTFWRPLSLAGSELLSALHYHIAEVFLGLEGASVPSVPLGWFKSSQRPPLKVSCVTKSFSSLREEI